MTVFPHPWTPRPAAHCAVHGCLEYRHWYIADSGREQCRRWCEDHSTIYDLRVAIAGPSAILNMEDYRA